MEYKAAVCFVLLPLPSSSSSSSSSLSSSSSHPVPFYILQESMLTSSICSQYLITSAPQSNGRPLFNALGAVAPVCEMMSLAQVMAIAAVHSQLHHPHFLHVFTVSVFRSKKTFANTKSYSATIPSPRLRTPLPQVALITNPWRKSKLELLTSAQPNPRAQAAPRLLTLLFPCSCRPSQTVVTVPLPPRRWQRGALARQ